MKRGGSSDEKSKEQIQQLEDKIAHLCNVFFEDTRGHIGYLHVDHGPCKKGKYPDEVINITVDVHWSAGYPKCEIERRSTQSKNGYATFEKKRKRWPNLK